MYSHTTPFLLISMLQCLFAFEAYGDLNVVGGVISLFFTLLFYFFKKDIFFIFNCLLSIFLIAAATKNPVLSNSPILLFLVSIIFLYYHLKPSSMKNYQPIVILMVAVVYIVSGVHKLNDGFFYSDASCATGFLNFFIQDLAPYRTFLAGIIVLTEIFLGFSFFIPSFRKLAFYIMVIFHSLASMGNSVVELFGVLMISLVAVSFWNDENSRAMPKYLTALMVAVFLSFFGFCLYKPQCVITNVSPGLFTLLLFGFLFKAKLPQTMKRVVFDFSFSKFLLPISYFLFSISGPYLGFREIGSLNMYSNLVPASQKTNHFFLGHLIPLQINPWKFRIKIYEVFDGTRAIYTGNLLVVPDEFQQSVEKIVSDSQTESAINGLHLKLKLYGENFDGSYLEALKIIKDSNTFLSIVLSRIIVPLNDEHYGEKENTFCAW